jgi:glucose dehydrogenase
MYRLTHGLACFLLFTGMAFSQAPSRSTDQEWRYYGHDPGGMRFSELNQVNTTNVAKLQRAWTYEVDRAWQTGVDTIETTPLMVEDVLYFTTGTSRVIAVDAETGKERWLFDPFAAVTPPAVASRTSAIGASSMPRWTRGCSHWIRKPANLAKTLAPPVRLTCAKASAKNIPKTGTR